MLSHALNLQFGQRSKGGCNDNGKEPPRPELQLHSRMGSVIWCCMFPHQQWQWHWASGKTILRAGGYLHATVLQQHVSELFFFETSWGNCLVFFDEAIGCGTIRNVDVDWEHGVPAKRRTAKQFWHAVSLTSNDSSSQSAPLGRHPLFKPFQNGGRSQAF